MYLRRSDAFPKNFGVVGDERHLAALPGDPGVEVEVHGEGFVMCSWLIDVDDVGVVVRQLEPVDDPADALDRVDLPEPGYGDVIDASCADISMWR